MKRAILTLAAVSLMSLGFAQTNISTVIACDANGNSGNVGATFTVRGIVTTVNIDPTHLNFYVQDATGGLDIFKTNSATYYTNKALAVGSDVTITGVVAFYNGLVELTPGAETDIVVNGTGPVPAPQTITINDLQSLIAEDQARFNMRSKIVKLENVYLATGSAAWPTSGNNANLTIAIGSAAGTPTATLRVDKDTDVDEGTEPVWPQTVTGLLTQFDSASPYWEGWQIMPKAYSDFQTVASVVDWRLFE